MFGVVGQVMDNATPILKHNLDQGLRQLLRKMVECVQDQVQNQGLVQVRITQYGEIILNKIRDTFHNTLAQWKSMLHNMFCIIPNDMIVNKSITKIFF